MAGRVPTVSDDEILSVIRSHEDPVVSTAEVAEDLPIGHQGTLNRLGDLRDGGYVHTKLVGNARAWWLTEDGQEAVQAELDGGRDAGS